jgi:hypothetical protein
MQSAPLGLWAPVHSLISDLLDFEVFTSTVRKQAKTLLQFWTALKLNPVDHTYENQYYSFETWSSPGGADVDIVALGCDDVWTRR